MLPAPADLTPILAELGLHAVRSITRLEGGSSDVFRLDLEDGTTVVFKAFVADYLHPHKDAYAASLLEGIDLPVTRYLMVDESRTRLPFRFALTSYLTGEIATTFADHPRYMDIFRQIGTVARRLHEIRLPAFGDIPPGGGAAQHATNLVYMRGQVDGSFARFLEFGGDPVMTMKLREMVERDFDVVVPQSGPAVFAHSDLQPHNILAQERDGELMLSGVIDYGNMRAESAAMDLAKAIFCSEHDAPGSGPAILEGYGPLNHPEPARALTFYTLLHRLTMWSWLRKFGALPSADTPSDIIEALRATAAAA